MKSIIKYLLSILLAASLSVSCSDVLDKNDLGAISETDVWNDALYAKAYLDYLVNANLPGWSASISSECDEAGDDRNSGLFIYGELNANNTQDTWHYDRIRMLNEYIEKIETGSIDAATQQLYKAQVLVLRAWRYFDMVSLYGGIPMVMKVQNLSDDLLVPRNKTSECISLIVKDLDDAIAVENFPYSW
ncbi:MAG: RagB/SusD family nutrient uptake outer membrane protein, partial [Tannerellaceae bacterium]|nr:RagB/SusD family nutrient uptake outer membrane protein [Tannerellaceae bacterium]